MGRLSGMVSTVGKGCHTVAVLVDPEERSELTAIACIIADVIDHNQEH